MMTACENSERIVTASTQKKNNYYNNQLYVRIATLCHHNPVQGRNKQSAKDLNPKNPKKFKPI